MEKPRLKELARDRVNGKCQKRNAHFGHVFSNSISNSVPRVPVIGFDVMVRNILLFSEKQRNGCGKVGNGLTRQRSNP